MSVLRSGAIVALSAAAVIFLAACSGGENGDDGKAGAEQAGKKQAASGQGGPQAARTGGSNGNATKMQGQRPGSGQASTGQAGRGQWGGRGGGKPGDAVPVRAQDVERRDVLQVYRTSATVRAQSQAPAVARASGILRRILVEEGDRVRRGQILARLEDDQAKLELERARVDLAVAERDYARANKLKNDQLISDEEYDQKRTALDQAKTQVSLAQLDLDYTTMPAPFSGVITKRHLDPGATVSPGDPVFEIADVSHFLVDVPVPEGTAARLKKGGTAVLDPIAVEGNVQATIERLSPVVDAQTGTVKVTLGAKPVPGLRAGAFVEVRVTTDKHENVLVVPSQALAADGDRFLVYRVEGDTAVAVAVETGFEDENGVEVTPIEEGALDISHRIVVAGVAALSDGVTIAVEGDPSAEGSGDATADARKPRGSRG